MHKPHTKPFTVYYIKDINKEHKATSRIWGECSIVSDRKVFKSEIKSTKMHDKITNINL
jgi:hypothetical protein